MPNFNFSWAPKVWSRAPGIPVWTEYFATAVPNPVVPSDDIRTCTTSEPMIFGATFDDGPSPFTPQLIDYFKNKSMLTTFYTVGSVAIQYPQIMLDTIHTWSHPKLTEVKSDDEIIAEFVYSAKAIHQVIGQAPRYIRPPYGQSNDRIRRLAATMGFQVVSYLDSQDWLHYNDQAKMEPLVLGHFRKWIEEKRMGIITLQHDVWQAEVTVAKKAMDLVVSAGYKITPIYKCLEESTPYGNQILEEFFASGQFETHAKLITPRKEIASTTKTLTTTTTTTPLSATPLTGVVVKKVSSNQRVTVFWSLLFLGLMIV
ncbi:UNVERIFIED_CONTAM: chitin deacetylase [Siphonaria sp. JEL0065]|nr:chitin deacetylase [Siphonaria sp. JEL0065]